MKSKVTVFTAANLILCPTFVYAEERRMDIAMMTALAQMIQYCSWLVFVIGIGMLIFSYQSQNGDMKANALKVLAAFTAMFFLLPLMRAVGFAY